MIRQILAILFASISILQAAETNVYIVIKVTNLATNKTILNIDLYEPRGTTNGMDVIGIGGAAREISTSNAWIEVYESLENFSKGTTIVSQVYLDNMRAKCSDTNTIQAFLTIDIDTTRSDVGLEQTPFNH